MPVFFFFYWSNFLYFTESTPHILLGIFDSLSDIPSNLDLSNLFLSIVDSLNYNYFALDNTCAHSTDIKNFTSYTVNFSQVPEPEKSMPGSAPVSGDKSLAAHEASRETNFSSRDRLKLDNLNNKENQNSAPESYSASIGNQLPPSESDWNKEDMLGKTIYLNNMDNENNKARFFRDSFTKELISSHKDNAGQILDNLHTDVRTKIFKENMYKKIDGTTLEDKFFSYHRNKINNNNNNNNNS